MTARARRHVVVIHRWRAEYVDYTTVLDHSVDAVTYVTTTVGRDRVPDGAAATMIVPATDDLPTVRAAVGELARQHGAPDLIVALKEDDLLVAAQLRAEWGCPGVQPDQTLRFIDKLAMASAVTARGLLVPACAPAPDGAAVHDFAAAHGWPLVVKPRIGSSSDGVTLLRRPAEVAPVSFGTRPLLVQVHNPHPIYHVDGIFLDGRLRSFRASRYVNSCLAFRGGDFLGSVEEDDPIRNESIGSATERFVSAFGVDQLVFHLELFVEQVGRAEVACTFLEIGARVGGAEIPFLWREVHGYDLMAAALQIQMFEPVTPPVVSQSDDIAGFLLIPAPAQRPCRITEVTPMVGRVPGPYAEALLDVGDVLPCADAYYEHVGGRFRFRGRSSADVEKAISATATDFRVSAVSIKEATR